MIDLGEAVSIDLSDSVNLAELIQHPERHHWKVNFKFPQKHRNPYATPNGKKYGSGKSFSAIYRELKSPFIDEYFRSQYPDSDVKIIGDQLLWELNYELDVGVDTIKTEQDEILKLNRNVDINKTRYANARSKLESIQLEYEAHVDYINSIEPMIKRRKDGDYDRRTRNYFLYQSEISKMSILQEAMERFAERENIEAKRVATSKRHKREAMINLRKLRSGTFHEMESKYKTQAEEFAKAVKDDIISRAQSGVLPMQNIGLTATTIKKREHAGINSFPRFWATGQLVQSIIITCTLV